MSYAIEYYNGKNHIETRYAPNKALAYWTKKQMKLQGYIGKFKIKKQ